LKKSRADGRHVNPRKLDSSFWLGPTSVSGPAPNATEACAQMAYDRPAGGNLAASGWALCSPPAAPKGAKQGGEALSSSVTCYEDVTSQTFCVSRNIMLDSRAFMGARRGGLLVGYHRRDVLAHPHTPGHLQLSGCTAAGQPRGLAHPQGNHWRVQGDGAPGAVRAACQVDEEKRGKAGGASLAPWFQTSLQVGPGHCQGIVQLQAGTCPA
jgi:hypothetical protein